MVAASPHGEISYKPRFRTSDPPLSCSYCLNPQCHNTPKVSSFYSPQDLLDIVKVDSLYFTATDGGITFGGGEPLLYSKITLSHTCELSLVKL